MRAQIQRLLNKAGYRIERIRQALPGPSLFVLDYLLYVLNERRAGAVSFVQIGANDGLQEDPCRAWISNFPWKGVLVEPQAHLASSLRAMYRHNQRIAVEQALISDKPGSAPLYYLRQSKNTPRWTSGIASVSKNTISSHRHKIPGFDSLLEEEIVPAVTFNQLLSKHGISKFDYLQIDAEGSDYQILKGVEIAKFKPAIICYEHANLTHEDNSACRELLGSHGYEFASWLGDTVACTRELSLVSEDRAQFLGVPGTAHR